MENLSHKVQTEPGQLINFQNKHDPFIREFLAFCKVHSLENKAKEMLSKKILNHKQQLKAKSS